MYILVKTNFTNKQAILLKKKLNYQQQQHIHNNIRTYQTTSAYTSIHIYIYIFECVSAGASLLPQKANESHECRIIEFECACFRSLRVITIWLICARDHLVFSWNCNNIVFKPVHSAVSSCLAFSYMYIIFFIFVVYRLICCCFFGGCCCFVFSDS